MPQSWNVTPPAVLVWSLKSLLLLPLTTGLGELIGYLQKFEDRQRKMALVKPSHRILALLKITKLDTVFKIFDSRETAMAYLTDNAA